MSSNLLTTKLNIPPVRKNIVHRPRLVQALEAGLTHGHGLTLVSAPAGYGKTTLVTEWLDNVQTKITWLGLEEADNDPARFLAYLVAALQQINPQIGASTRLILQSPQLPPPDVLLTGLTNEIASQNTAFIFVLDDYHVIESLPIHQLLSFLVDHKPPQMHLVIITREDPPLPLARLRARGQMTEIRQDDLRFSMDECTDFLQRVMGLHLSIDELAALEHRTEGWITGLQLAALSMQGWEDLPGFIRDFSGSSHFVLEYLIEEVLERQPPDIQDFLLKTSLLDRLCGSLCDSVSGRAGSQDVLEHLEHNNLFITPLDQSHRWYRYHHLFADLLRQKLDSSDPLCAAELHRRASYWFSSNAFFPEAIQHALAGQDWDLAASLIGDHAPILLKSGELGTLLRWFKCLPDEVVFRQPTLCRDYGWVLSLTGQFQAADIYLRRAETITREDKPLLGTIFAGRAFNLRSSGDASQAIEYARRALELIPQSDSLTRGLVALTLGLAYWKYGDFHEAESAFQEAEQAAQLSGNHYARLSALTYIGIAQAVCGRLHQAAGICRRVIELGGQSPLVAPAHIEMGALLYEWNDLDSAIKHLHTGIEQSQRTANTLIESDGYRTLAILYLGRGEYAAALATIQKSDQMDDRHQLNPLAGMRNAAFHVQLALAQGDLNEARYWAEKVTESTDTSVHNPCIGLTPVRILLARHEKAEAMQKLNRLYETSRDKGWGVSMIEVRALQALAAEEQVESLEFLRDALQMAQAEGFIRTFVDKGEPMKALLEKLRSQGGELKEYILAILASFGTTSKASTPQSLVERLSERELDVLRLLAEGKSNQEIAERLILSVGTIKTHVHSIIEKLGAHSRTQAVARARELKIL